MKETIKRLEEAIVNAVDNCVGEQTEGADLIAAAGEAVGVLKTLQGFNLAHIMYDMARLAGSAGYTPDDFDDKAKGGVAQRESLTLKPSGDRE